MAAGNVLKKITTRAKAIRRAHGGTWPAAIKKAGAEYRSGRGAKVVSMRKPAKRKARKRKVGASTGVLYNSTGKRATAAMAAMGFADGGMIGSVGKHMQAAKKIIAHKIGMEEVKKLSAKTKTAKRKIAKRIAKHKVQLRKLC